MLYFVDDLLPYLVMPPLKKAAFDASSSDYDNIQSELDHWKNLIFSFDMGDERPPRESSDANHSHKSSESKVSNDSSSTYGRPELQLL